MRLKSSSKRAISIFLSSIFLLSITIWFAACKEKGSSSTVEPVNIWDEKNSVWNSFGPGANDPNVSNSNPDLFFGGLKVPKDGPFEVHITFTSNNCLTCCRYMQPTIPGRNACKLEGRPVWASFTTFDGTETDPTFVFPTPFQACNCC